MPLRKVLGPGVILLATALGSGEYVLWPFIASHIGLTILWAAIVAIAIQFFINMEVERYTLATGETAITGFTRLWKPWWALFIVMAVVPNMWPGFATGAATCLSFVVGDLEHPARRHPRADRGRAHADRLAGRLPDRREAPDRRHPRGHRVARAGRLPRHDRRRVGRPGQRLRQLRLDPDQRCRHRRRAGRRDRVRGLRRLRQPRGLQLGARQGHGHGPLHPAHRVADERRAGGRAVEGLHVRAQRAEHAPLAGLVEGRQHRAGGHVLADRHARHRDPRRARLLDRVRQGHRRGLRLHQGRGRRALGHGRAVVRHRVLARRLLQAAVDDARQLRLRQPHHGRRGEDQRRRPTASAGPRAASTRRRCGR